MFFKISIFILAVTLPAIHSFGGGGGGGLASKLSALLGNNNNNNNPVTTTSTYTLPQPAPEILTISPVTSPTNTYISPTTSPIIYYTPTYVPTPFPVPYFTPTGTIVPGNRSLADAMDDNASSDGGRRARRRQRVQRVYPKRGRRMLKRVPSRRRRG